MNIISDFLSFLPVAIQPVVASLVVFIVLVPLFIKKIINPFLFFISNKIFNKEENRQKLMINDNNSNDDIIKECINEVNMLKKMKLVKSSDRMIGLYFYELVKLSKHIIHFSKFKRLYPFLNLKSDGIRVNDKKMKKYNRRYTFLFIFCFFLMLLYFILLANNLENTTISMACLFMTAVCEISGLLILDLKVKKDELTEFSKINKIYGDEIMENLKAEFKNITDL